MQTNMQNNTDRKTQGHNSMETIAPTEAEAIIWQAERAPELAVTLLKQTNTYPEKPQRIDVIETHMSWVFLTEHTVYKLKKPARYDFLDFSTLSARKKYCAEEVYLNRRLTKNVYIGMVPLLLDANGRASIGESEKAGACEESGKNAQEKKGQEVLGKGQVKVIDWLVKMRRLPAKRMLDYMIGRHRLNHKDIQKLAQRLIEFYQYSAAIKINASDYLQQLEKSVRINFTELVKPKYGLSESVVNKVHNFQLGLLHNEPELFAQRVRQGRIVEGHGDLRPEHVCLEEEPVIFDCLEFNREFRIVDCVDELSSLSMECELLDAPEVGDELFLRYEKIIQDKVSPRLIHFYKSYRACVRARLAILHVRELERAAWPKWQHRAERYLLLAESYRLAD